MHVEVVARVMVPEERTSITSNVFHFTFASNEVSIGKGGGRWGGGGVCVAVGAC